VVVGLSPFNAADAAVGAATSASLHSASEAAFVLQVVAPPAQASGSAAPLFAKPYKVAAAVFSSPVTMASALQPLSSLAYGSVGSPSGPAKVLDSPTNDSPAAVVPNDDDNDAPAALDDRFRLLNHDIESDGGGRVGKIKPLCRKKPSDGEKTPVVVRKQRSCSQAVELAFWKHDREPAAAAPTWQRHPKQHRGRGQSPGLPSAGPPTSLLLASAAAITASDRAIAAAASTALLLDVPATDTLGSFSGNDDDDNDDDKGECDRVLLMALHGESDTSNTGSWCW
jgi:hypothetical protein